MFARLDSARGLTPGRRPGREGSDDLHSVWWRGLGQAGKQLGVPSIQKYDIPIRQAATSSLEALKLYSTARLERNKGNDRAAEPLLQRAVELDPDFAIAWRHLGAALRSTGRFERSNDALMRAFELRDRVPEQDRYFIASRYYGTISGDIDKARETNVMWARVYPRNFAPHHNLCLLYWRSGDTGRALPEYREAVRLEPAGNIYDDRTH